MTPWKRIVTLTAMGCLIAGAAPAQQQIRPPNMKSTPQAPNTPLQAPSHWGPALDPQKEPGHETTQQKPPKALKPPKPPKPPKEARKKPREDRAGLKGDADAETSSVPSSDAAGDSATPPASSR